MFYLFFSFFGPEAFVKFLSFFCQLFNQDIGGRDIQKQEIREAVE